MIFTCKGCGRARTAQPYADARSLEDLCKRCYNMRKLTDIQIKISTSKIMLLLEKRKSSPRGGTR